MLVKEAYLESYESTLPWASSIKNVLTVFNLENVWLNQGTYYSNKIIRLLKQYIANQYDQKWVENMNRADSKLRLYKTFKHKVSLENYLVTIKNINHRKHFTRLRISAHQLHIETGRHKKTY